MSVKVTKDYSTFQEKNVKIAMNKSLLKEFNKDGERVVYLENGDEFQIQIFNDQTTEIGAKIYVNNELVGNSYLVIKPGERVWLDRYLSKAVKFRFSTYEVNGNNEQVRKAIEKNGIVKVELFRKKENYIYDLPLISTYPSRTWEPQILYCNTPYSTCTAEVNSSAATPINASVNFCSTLGCTDSNVEFGVSSFTSTCTAENTAASKTFYKGDSSANTRCKTAKLSNKIETGRVSEGSHSDQEFNYVSMSFECWPFDIETIHILPKSTKPVYADDLQKIYCHNCGRKLKSKFKFCPFCGARL